MQVHCPRKASVLFIFLSVVLCTLNFNNTSVTVTLLNCCPPLRHSVLFDFLDLQMTSNREMDHCVLKEVEHTEGQQHGEVASEPGFGADDGELAKCTAHDGDQDEDGQHGQGRTRRHRFRAHVEGAVGDQPHQQTGHDDVDVVPICPPPNRDVDPEYGIQEQVRKPRGRLPRVRGQPLVHGVELRGVAVGHPPLGQVREVPLLVRQVPQEADGRPGVAHEGVCRYSFLNPRRVSPPLPFCLRDLHLCPGVCRRDPPDAGLGVVRERRQVHRAGVLALEALPHHDNTF
mmetsp:Transcript_50297/g.89827  ORF Transcript_50297/g.89827 Transcript_50297/m.89827 type:complete len:287 (-) Transcript_50297:497-1357(-)